MAWPGRRQNWGQGPTFDQEGVDLLLLLLQVDVDRTEWELPLWGRRLRARPLWGQPRAPPGFVLPSCPPELGWVLGELGTEATTLREASGSHMSWGHC